jgi:hypothetical protein
MYGPPSETGSRTSIQHVDGTQAGVIPRAIHEIFELGNNQEVLSFSVFWERGSGFCRQLHLGMSK